MGGMELQPARPLAAFDVRNITRVSASIRLDEFSVYQTDMWHKVSGKCLGSYGCFVCGRVGTETLITYEGPLVVNSV